MSMGKSSRGILAKLASIPSPMMDKQPDHPMEINVRRAKKGGFIVKTSGGKTPSYNSEDEVYPDLDGVMECMEKHFGKAEKSEAGEKPGEA